jgi:hypothetical protein
MTARTDDRAIQDFLPPPLVGPPCRTYERRCPGVHMQGTNISTTARQSER